jgi:predicted ATPase
MEIKELKIEGFKSLGSIQLNDLNPFTVFVGPNGAGKSNIFEALEFWALCNVMDPNEVKKLFGRANDIVTKSSNEGILSQIRFVGDFVTFNQEISSPIYYEDSIATIKHLSKRYRYSHNPPISIHEALSNAETSDKIRNEMIQAHFSSFSRLFVGKKILVKSPFQDDTKLALDTENLEKVLKRILKNEIYRAEIEEILQLLIPGFDRIDVVTEELSGSDNLVVYEQSLKKPLTKRLISDGTYNIIALITAINQSEEPQFLCIEEPENGLNPKVVKELVTIFRQKCQEKGHFIWLNTHSQTLVSELHPDEIVLVDKVDGLTQVKQIKGMNLHGMKMDEALMTNALGGGIPW